MKDATYITLAGYAMATVIIVAMLIKDGQVAMATAAGAAAAGAGVGQFLGAKAAKVA